MTLIHSDCTGIPMGFLVRVKKEGHTVKPKTGHSRFYLNMMAYFKCSTSLDTPLSSQKLLNIQHCLIVVNVYVFVLIPNCQKLLICALLFSEESFYLLVKKINHYRQYIFSIKCQIWRQVFTVKQTKTPFVGLSYTVQL